MDSSPVTSKRHPGQIATVSFLLACMWLSPFHINTPLLFVLICFTKWPPATILDDRKSLSITFFAILDQYTTFFFNKMDPAAILDDRKSLSIAFLAISDQYAIFIFLNFVWMSILPKSIGLFVVCWSLTSLCHSNGHIETMPAREINPFTALTRIRYQFLRTQWSTSNHSEWTRLRLRPLSHRGWPKIDRDLPL